MMGEYLSFADKCIQKFKPIIEERTRTKLEDVIAKDICTMPDYVDDAYHGTRMLVSHKCPDSIFVNQDDYERDKASFSEIPVGVAHELAHLAHRKLIDKVREGDKRADISGLVKRYRKSKSFREGFAEYTSLNHLIDVYDDEAVKKAAAAIGHIGGYSKFSREGKPYERGYKFFRKVLNVIGEDKVFDVARSPPIAELEVRMPILYLLRKYPAKGIKNIPKFLAKGIRTKILKTLYGYAPFDFNRHVKAIRVDQSQQSM